ncbi:MAG: hypothetical protein JW953_23425 [Anaerolineae bacterium]|nr:hypothetical protein [Anaerolineae bacterium]
MDTGGGLSLQIAQINAKIVLEKFLVEAKMKIVGNLDNTLNDERYNYITITDGIAMPWHQSNPLKPIKYTESVLKIEELVLVYPMQAEAQAAIQRMPRSEPAIIYAGDFAIHGNISMGGDMTLSTVLDAVNKRFLTLTEASIFPMTQASTAIPEEMPLVLLNRSKIYQLHGIG